MKWHEIQAAYPDTWLVVEAIQSHKEDDIFVADDIAVVEQCLDGAGAFSTYRRLHQLDPARDWIFAHTSRPHLRVEERPWVGIRAGR